MRLDFLTIVAVVGMRRPCIERSGVEVDMVQLRSAVKQCSFASVPRQLARSSHGDCAVSPSITLVSRALSILDVVKTILYRSQFELLRKIGECGWLLASKRDHSRVCKTMDQTDEWI